jgi:hypothetical protein
MAANVAMPSSLHHCRSSAQDHCRSRERQRFHRLAIRRIDEDLVAVVTAVYTPARLLRAGERELLDTRLEDREDAGLEPGGIEGVEKLRLGKATLKISSMMCLCEGPTALRS